MLCSLVYVRSCGGLVARTFKSLDDAFGDGRQLGHVSVAAGDGTGLKLGSVLRYFRVGR